MKQKDKEYMQRAIALAAQAEGRTRPNPMVGALVVRGRTIVGEGYHAEAGKSHAEVVALRRAGKKARGADLYVTLEPCCHHGRTPPCTEAIIASGVRRVIYGMRDPFPAMRGKGLRQLRAAGIEVIGPVCANAVRALNRIYLHWVKTGRPYVVVKVGSTLDGKIADGRGASQWITNRATRDYTHGWRARVDGIVVGLGTVKQDDPQLTIRLPRYRGPQPRPILWLGAGAVPWQSRLLSDRQREAWCVVEQPRPATARKLAARGHRLIVARDVPQLLRQLGDAGLSAVMVEGGAVTAGHFLRGGWVDYCVTCVAPKLLGGAGKGWTDTCAWQLPTSPEMQVEKVLTFDDNVVIEGAFRA